MNSLFPVWLKKLKKTERQVEDIANKSAITTNHVFADNTARDAYFVTNPTELVENLFIKVGTGYQQYLNETWEDSSPVLVETLDDASLIDYDNTASGLAATQVQAAIDELMSEKVDKVTLALVDEKTRIANSNPNNYTGAVVTFIDDDGGQYINDIWLPIITEKGIKMGFAVVTGFISGEESYAPIYTPTSIQQLQDLYNDGHDIYSHSYSHPAFYDNGVSIQEIENQCILSQDWLKNNGFERNADIIVYPGGLGQSQVAKKNVIRKHYRYGIDTDAQVNPNVVDNWCIYRINADTLSLEQLKAKVDEAVANGRWLVLMNHAYQLNLDKTNQMNKIRGLIDYIRSVNVPIMPFSEAEKLKGNSLAIGEYTTSPKTFVNHKGEALGVIQPTNGSWQPTLAGSTVAGTHVYTTRAGNWEKIGRMVFLTFDIRIEWANLDALMSGNLWLTGLPFVAGSLVKAPIEYNHLTLGTNYSEVISSVTPADNKILFFRQGNGVGTAFVNVSHLTPNQPIILRGQISYFTTQ